MKKRVHPLILTFLSVGMLLTNCNKLENQENIEPQGNKKEVAEPQGTIHENENGRIELFPNAKPILVADAKMLTAMTSDKLVYRGENDFFNSIKVGDILISPNTDIAPDGFLRLVNRIEKTGDGYIFHSTNTTLDKAIKKGVLHLAAPIMFPDNILPLEDVNQEENQTKAGTFSLSRTWNYPLNYTLYDRDGSSSTTYDRIRTNGNFSLSASMVVDLTFGFFSLEYFRVRAPLTASNNQTLTIGGAFTIARSNRIANVTTIPSAGFFVGIVYVSIKPYFRLFIDYGGTINAYATFGYNGSTTITPQIRYQNGSWSTSAPITYSLVGNRPTTNVSATFGASLRARLTFALYGCEECASAYVEGSVYGRITCTTSPLSKRIRAGISAGAGAVLMGWNKDYPGFLDYPINL